MTSAAALVGRSLIGRSASEGIDPRRNLPHGSLTGDSLRRDLPHDSRPDLPHSSLTGDSLRRNPPYGFRQAAVDDARAIHELITRHREEGRLLPRQLGEIAVHTSRFVVAVEASEGPADRLRQGSGGQEAGHHSKGEIVGCADLAPLSRTVAEIRSLVVSEDARSAGIGRLLIDAVIARAGASGFERICAFTHAPSYFVQLGFSIVPHDWLPEKIRTDCGTCTQFRTCGQYAVMLPLKRARLSSVSLASLHG